MYMYLKSLSLFPFLILFLSASFIIAFRHDFYSSRFWDDSVNCISLCSPCITICSLYSPPPPPPAVALSEALSVTLARGNGRLADRQLYTAAFLWQGWNRDNILYAQLKLITAKPSVQNSLFYLHLVKTFLIYVDNDAENVAIFFVFVLFFSLCRHVGWGFEHNHANRPPKGFVFADSNMWSMVDTELSETIAVQPPSVTLSSVHPP